MTSVEKVKAEVKIRTAQQPNPPLPVLLLPLFRTPHPRAPHDLCSQGLESLSVDDVGRLMIELDLEYCVDPLKKEKVDGTELKQFEKDFALLPPDHGLRTNKAMKAYTVIFQVT